MHDLPPLPWLRAFEVAARHLSFTAAAQELALSQAAVSKQVKLLEFKLGEPLFRRLPRSLQLTRTGEAFLPKVQDAFERLAAGAGEVFGQKRKDILTVRCAVGFAVNWLAPRLPDFMARYPELPLRLISSVWNEEDSAAAFDIDIRYGNGKWPGVRSERLTHEVLHPVCSPAYIESKNLRSPADLLEHCLIHVLGYREGWALWLKQAGLRRQLVTPGLQVDNSLMAFRLAAAGAGVALARSSMLPADLAAANLAIPLELGVPVEEGFFLITRDKALNLHQVQLFRHWLLEASKAQNLPA
jgi:LysR family transcriptional regulator, glycine cleavage system transcriptional activator